jgi:hypothetical protein
MNTLNPLQGVSGIFAMNLAQQQKENYLFLTIIKGKRA